MRLIILALAAWLGTAGLSCVQTMGAMSESLTALADAQTDAGEGVLSDKERAYLEGLNEHLIDLLNRVVENEVITAPEHLRTILSMQLRPQKMEILLQDNCILCHTDVEIHDEETLFTPSSGSSDPAGHLSLPAFLDSSHFRRNLSCAGCHGGDPSADVGHEFVAEWPEEGRQENRLWVLDFCARCHSDPTYMNRFNPSLPTDQLAKFRESRHGALLIEQKDHRGPDCISCHGHHSVRDAKSPLSKVYPKAVPATCGSCHADSELMAGFKLPNGAPFPTDQLAEYQRSVHGRALLERGDLGAPACNDCHGNHAAMPVGLSSVSQSCSLCHTGNASLFDGSKHKLAFEKHDWPQCAQCHSNHGIQKTGDAMLGTGPESMCVECHQEYASDNPKCTATADYFHDSLVAMDAALEKFDVTSELLAAKGLDVDPIQAKLNELDDNLKRARSYIHSFDSNSFQQVALPGQEAVMEIERLVEEAGREYRVRQSGLMASIGLLALLMTMLYIKLRHLEKTEQESIETSKNSS